MNRHNDTINSLYLQQRHVENDGTLFCP